MGIALEGWDDVAKLKAEAKAAEIANKKALAAEAKLNAEAKAAAEHKDDAVEVEVIGKKAGESEAGE